uniref:WAT1-related protein n=1 Tax=Chloropicon laureae TaxID=464258 RepID=A0A7S3E2U4_9CHLO|mmetsp:Transcript_4396/g.11094  ORF Transcript_4396/g.11094 Transcript_4396/m.11094 type:complete len:368 (+) Transcript_4396:222-1325(+)
MRPHKLKFSPPPSPSASSDGAARQGRWLLQPNGDGSSSPFQWLQEERRNRNRAVAALCLVQTLFALGTVLTKYTLLESGVNTLVLLLYRDIASSVILVAIATRLHGLPRRKDLAPFLLAGFCMFLNHALFIVGVDLSGALVASCVQPSQPVVTLAIAVLVGQERLTFNRCAGLACAVVGAVCVVVGDMLMQPGKSHADAKGKDNNAIWGDGALLANCVAAGACYVVMKALNRMYDSTLVIAWIYVVASGFLMATAGVFVSSDNGAGGWALPGEAVPALVYLVLVSSVLGYILISWSNNHLDSSQVSSFTCLQPMVGAVGATLLLDEGATAGEVLGGLLIIAGLMLTMAEPRKRKLRAAGRGDRSIAD